MQHNLRCFWFACEYTFCNIRPGYGAWLLPGGGYTAGRAGRVNRSTTEKIKKPQKEDSNISQIFLKNPIDIFETVCYNRLNKENHQKEIET